MCDSSDGVCETVVMVLVMVFVTVVMVCVRQ